MKTHSSLFALALVTAGVLVTPLTSRAYTYDRPSDHRTDVIVAHLDTDVNIRTIGDTSYAARKQLTTDLENRVKATHDALEEINTSDLPADVRSEYRSALSAEGDARSTLNARIRAARSSDADSWEVNRTALAATYRYYSEAASRVESFVNGSRVSTH